MNNVFGKTAMSALMVVVVAGAAQAGDFGGAYAGVSGRLATNTTASVDPAFGAFAGYNYDTGAGIIGAEVSAEYDGTAGYLGTGTAITTLVDARVGAEITPDILIYGKGGVGYTTAGTGEAVYDVGGGAEYMVTDGVSLRGEVERVAPLAGGGFGQHNVKLGVGYHF